MNIFYFINPRHRRNVKIGLNVNNTVVLIIFILHFTIWCPLRSVHRTIENRSLLFTHQRLCLRNRFWVDTVYLIQKGKPDAVDHACNPWSLSSLRHENHKFKVSLSKLNIPCVKIKQKIKSGDTAQWQIPQVQSPVL